MARSHYQAHACSVGSGHHAICIVQSDSQRLIDQDVFAACSDCLHVISMHLVGRGDVNGIDFRVRRQLLHCPIGTPPNSATKASRLSARGAAAATSRTRSSLRKVGSISMKARPKPRTPSRTGLYVKNQLLATLRSGDADHYRVLLFVIHQHHVAVVHLARDELSLAGAAGAAFA